MKKISIIVPVYNVQNYIRRCIESLMHQTLKDIEIILVDDGSTDLSGIICDEYAERFGMNGYIISLHQENAGASVARNKGLSVATGEFIGFVDADDYIAPEMYEKLYFAAKNSDIVMCGWNAVKENKIILSDNYNLQDGIVLDKQRIYQEIQKGDKNHLTWFTWNKLYRHNLVNDKLYLESICFGEDILFNIDTFLSANSIAFVADRMYFYEQRNDSVINTKYKSNFAMELNKAYLERMNLYKKYNLQNYENALYQYSLNHSLNMILGNELSSGKSFIQFLKTCKGISELEIVYDALKYGNIAEVFTKTKYVMYNT